MCARNDGLWLAIDLPLVQGQRMERVQVWSLTGHPVYVAGAEAMTGHAEATTGVRQREVMVDKGSYRRLSQVIRGYHCLKWA